LYMLLFGSDTQSVRPLVILCFLYYAAPTVIYTLSLHDALPISRARAPDRPRAAFRHGTPPSSSRRRSRRPGAARSTLRAGATGRSEEHTSELQSRGHLVCRLRLEKKTK